MNETIVLKQFDGGMVTPKDDAIMYDSFIGETGLLEGCDLTHTGAGQIRIGAGRGIIKGRQFVIQEHTISVALSSDMDMQGRVYIQMNLSDTAAPVKILHVTAAALPELEQDKNCNNNNGVYEIELGTYTASKLAISNLKKTIKQISPKLAKGMVVDNPDDVGAVTEEGYPVGCKALNGLLGGIRFGVDADGNCGYIKAGADTVTPFKTGGTQIYGAVTGNNSWTVNIKRNSPTLKVTGAGYFADAFGSPSNRVALGIYAATEDNTIPCHVYNGAILPTIQTISVYADMPTVEVDVSAYPRLVIYAIYGTATVHGSARVYVLIEN